MNCNCKSIQFLLNQNLKFWFHRPLNEIINDANSKLHSHHHAADPGVTSYTEPFGSLMIQPVKPFECCKSQNLLKQL